MQLQIFATRRPFGSELDMMKRLPRWITMREGSGNSYTIFVIKLPQAIIWTNGGLLSFVP